MEFRARWVYGVNGDCPYLECQPYPQQPLVAGVGAYAKAVLLDEAEHGLVPGEDFAIQAPQAVAARVVEELCEQAPAHAAAAPVVGHRQRELGAVAFAHVGSGMGLAMVHGIVHQHGGHVMVESVAGAGTRFGILLPPAVVPAKGRTGAAPTTSSTASARLSGRVLLAEDEPSIRELLEDLLGGWGLEVVACADGAAARDAFAEDPQSFDLVLTDQTMPRLTGLQLARLVTRMRPGIPVILCTGYGEDLTPRELDTAGVRTLAKKPVEPAQLRELLRAALPTRNKEPT